MTQGEVITISKTFQSGKAAGYDNIPMSVIKQTIDSIAEPLQGHSPLWDRAVLNTDFASLKSVYLSPKSNVRVRYV